MNIDLEFDAGIFKKTVYVFPSRSPAGFDPGCVPGHNIHTSIKYRCRSGFACNSYALRKCEPDRKPKSTAINFQRLMNRKLHGEISYFSRISFINSIGYFKLIKAHSLVVSVRFAQSLLCNLYTNRAAI